MRVRFLLWFWPLVLAAASAQAITPGVVLNQSTCERMLTAIYAGRLPLVVGHNTERRSARCVPSAGQRITIEHHDHVLEDVTPEALARVRPAVQRVGAANALVRQRCAQPAFRDFLHYADVEFHLYARDEPLGVVRISVGMCDPQILANKSKGTPPRARQ